MENGEARMCILDQGVVSRAGMILTRGASWGDLLISSPMLRDTRPAKALGYCEVVTLCVVGSRSHDLSADAAPCSLPL